MKNKARLAVFFSVGAIILTFILFAIPGQFANLIPGSTMNYTMGGYQFFFGGSKECAQLQTLNVDGKVFSSVGIALVVLLVLAVVCYAFERKSSAIELLAGIIVLICSIMLFCAKSWIAKAYTHYASVLSTRWVPYFCGAILLVAAAVTFYSAIKRLVSEAKQPYQANKKDTYSYLKNK